MFRKSISLALALLLSAGHALATCTIAVSVSNSSTQIVAANDVLNTPLNQRHYLLLQNTGATNDAFCCIGTSNTCTITTGMQLFKAGGQWLMISPSSAAQVPGGDIACITAASTTVVTLCDW